MLFFVVVTMSAILFTTLAYVQLNLMGAVKLHRWVEHNFESNGRCQTHQVGGASNGRSQTHQVGGA